MTVKKLNIYTNDVTDGFLSFIEAAKKKVLEIYPRHTIDSWTAEQVDARAYQVAIATIEVDRENKTAIQYRLVASAYERGLYISDGYDDIRDWLDDFAGIPSARSGRMSQVVALATEIVPWCSRNGVMAMGRKVDNNLIGSVVNGISLSNRARQFVKQFRDIINDQDLTYEFKIEALSQIWEHVTNPNNSVRAIRDILSGAPADDVIVYTTNGAPIFAELNSDEIEWIKRLARRSVKYVEVGNPIFMSETGNVSMNPESFASTTMRGSTGKIYI